MYNILCLNANLIALIIFNIIFQNQYATMKNVVLEVAQNPLLAKTYPVLCLHQSAADDLMSKFKDSFSIQGLAM